MNVLPTIDLSFIEDTLSRMVNTKVVDDLVSVFEKARSMGTEEDDYKRMVEEIPWQIKPWLWEGVQQARGLTSVIAEFNGHYNPHIEVEFGCWSNPEQNKPKLPLFRLISNEEKFEEHLNEIFPDFSVEVLKSVDHNDMVTTRYTFLLRQE